jgi:predicted transcriptional regulator
MTTAKEVMVDIISRQPDDSSYDALLRELAYARMIQRGLQDAAEGRMENDADVKNAIDSWQK